MKSCINHSTTDFNSNHIPFIVLETGHASSIAESGGEKLFKKLHAFLPKKFDIKVVLPKLAVAHWQRLNHNVTPIILPKDPLGESQNRLIIFINYLARIYHSYRALDRLECEQLKVIYSSTNIFPDIIPAYLYKKHYPQTKWIARIHHLTPPPYQRTGNPLTNILIYPLQRLSLKMIRRQADLILVLNNTLREKLLRQGFPKNKTKVSGAGIDFQQIQNYQPSSADQFTGAFVGRLHPSKGIFDLPEIWKHVVKEKKNATLAIIGAKSPTVEDKIIKEFTKQGVNKKNYTILGYLPEAEKFNILRNSQVFLFCDHEAGWGIAIAEAMACGLAVIGYDLPILGDVFQKGFIKVSQSNTRALGKAVISLLSDTKQYQRLSQEALEQARELDWGKTGRKFKALIEEILNEDKISNT